MPNRSKILLGASVLLGAAAFLLYFGRTSVGVEIATVSVQSIQEYVVETGTTRLAASYAVYMPIAGTLHRIELQAGDAVTQGDVLAHIDPFNIEKDILATEGQIAAAEARTTGVDTSKPKPEDIEAARQAEQFAASNEVMARKQLEIAKINLANASKDNDRAKRLLETGAISRTAFDEAERKYKLLQEELEYRDLAVESASQSAEIARLKRESLTASVNDNEFMRKAYEAEIETIKARQDVRRNELLKADLRSPITGVVIEKLVETEGILQAGTPLLILGDLSDIEIESDILSEEVVRMRVGQPVEVTGKALGDVTAKGEISRIYPVGFKKISALGIEQQRVKVVIRFDNTALKLRPGTSVDVRIITNERDGTLTVPERATFRNGGEWSVFVHRGGRAVLTRVKLGLRNEKWAEVLQGLHAGDAVIAEPRNELKNGTRVRPL
ncbi:MAG: efflux RND transporter periplasmic adaptor subunit [Candidatus Hydrogenedentes bacterium]|nr:efflux RND transporter periplasmic adaptor subunit [Candidatus Hydrogenedentota bacterium]